MGTRRMGARMDLHIGARRRAHAFAGFDSVGCSCTATCACGWSSSIQPAKERALVAYGIHRANPARQQRS